MLALTGGAGALGAEEKKTAPPDTGYVVTLELSVNETGRVDGAVVKETDDEILNGTAINLAKTWQLKTRISDGHAVKYKVLAPINFPVKGDGGAEANKQPLPNVTKYTGRPEYPRNMRERKETGGAILELQVSAKGKLTGVKVLRASHPEFAESAVRAVREWKFSPALQEGRPIEAKVALAVVFLLEGARLPAHEWFLAPRPCLPRLSLTGSFLPW